MSLPSLGRLGADADPVVCRDVEVVALSAQQPVQGELVGAEGDGRRVAVAELGLVVQRVAVHGRAVLGVLQRELEAGFK